MRKKTPAKITDVAKLAGVSPATVSRALNSPDLLEATTLERVRAAAQKLHYQPLGIARSLRRRRSMVLGTLIQSMENASYIAQMVEFSQARLAEHGYTMLLASASFDDDLAVQSCRAMINQGVDAIMLVATRRGSEVFSLLQSHQIPHVEAWVHDPAVPSFGFDHGEVMLQVAEHLLDLGHRAFAVVIPFRKINDRQKRRLHGLEHAFASHGIGRQDCLVIDDTGFGIRDGREAMARILREAPRTTAVICANDYLAAGAILECAERGLDVPGDVSITGYNDLEIAAAMRPAITSVRTPYEPVAAASIEYLLAQLDGKPAPKLNATRAELVLRESTGARKAGRARKPAVRG